MLYIHLNLGPLPKILGMQMILFDEYVVVFF